MKKYLIFLPFLFWVQIAFGQSFVWQAGVHSFFDNCEFVGFPEKTSQTMSGVHFAPQVGLNYKEKHQAFIGIDAMHDFGSQNAIEHYDPIAYYQYTSRPFTFYMGAFPRMPLLKNYPRMFFQDSIINYRPVLNGIYLGYESEKHNYINVWLDWTGKQTIVNRETFLLGWEGRYNRGIFYAQQFGYVYHFARTAATAVPGIYFLDDKMLNPAKDPDSLNLVVVKPEVHDAINDNMLVLSSVGIDLAEKCNFDKLEINAGWSIAIERDRSQSEWYLMNGFLSEARIEYRGIGLFNSFYIGDPQQIYYNIHGTYLYWGDSGYRVSPYNRADFYVQFFKSNRVDLKMTYSLHFAHGSVFQEQMLTANIDLDNLKKPKGKKYQYIWDNWFKEPTKLEEIQPK